MGVIFHPFLFSMLFSHNVLKNYKMLKNEEKELYIKDTRISTLMTL